ncbi:PCNA-interacting partner [Corythoichthys intestinalis]|uniref:PCNA-interacting partner n=1 Tax=Corythoichthys intestinalis TaxID=161448 RepID=UPI0025A54177|nr:PCNA-interacting partner [Corythoichthys intestinalis]XP_057712167.1 PCNA-interacting partner [Corythoichthys intestinalis]XP_061809570.1 PCNA-interacting partner-like [Nerophis lumbriciformis]
MAAIGEGLKQMLRIFRRESHRSPDSERTTVHGADAMLMVLQLVVAQVNKQQSGEFQAALSDVLLAWKDLLADRLGLRPPDDEASRAERRDAIAKAYEAFLKRSNAVDLVHVVVKYGSIRRDSDPEELVGPAQLYDFLSGSTIVSDASVPSTPPPTVRTCGSRVKSVVRRVFLSYLSLLVNAKDDLAVALTLNVPARALGRQTFADVRHAASRSGMSLFLAVTSFVRAIQLGGKGYAPAPSDPLRNHIKGLSAFVHFLDSLQEILGETPDPGVCGSKLLCTIRGVLAKGCDFRDFNCATEETANLLKEEICKVQKDTAHGEGSGISPARPKAYAVNHATAYGGRDTVKVLLALLDDEAAAPPTANKADLLSEEQAVLDGSAGTSILTLFRSPEAPAGSSPEPLKKRVQSRLNLLKPETRPRAIRSQFACTYRDEEERPLNRVLDFPSSSQLPTCVHPAPKPKNAPTTTAEPSEIVPPLVSRSGNARPRPESVKTTSKKRIRLDAEMENEPPQKKKQLIKTRVKTDKKKMIAGQATITSFFRV